MGNDFIEKLSAEEREMLDSIIEKQKEREAERREAMLRSDVSQKYLNELTRQKHKALKSNTDRMMQKLVRNMKQHEKPKY